MNLARESFYSLLFLVSSHLCATIAGIIIARVLGPANKGIIAVVLLYPTLFLTVFSFTAGFGIIYHMGKSEHDSKVLTGSALTLFFVLSVLALTVFLITVIYFREILYKGIDARYLIFVGVSIPFIIMLYYFSSMLQGSMDIKGYNITNRLSSFSNLFLILIFLFLWRLGVIEALIAGISGIVLGGILSFFWAIKKSGGISFDSKFTNILLKDSFKIHFGAIANFVFSRANLFILNYFAIQSEVGFYAIALTIANALFFFSVSLEIGLYPKMAHANIDDAINLVQVATRQMLLITGLVALIMAVFSKGIVLLYGGKAFLPAVTPLLLLLPGIVVYVIPKMLSTLWVRKGWFLPLTFIATGTALFSLIFNFLLIPKFGAKGAALSTAATYGFSSLIAVFLFWKYVKKDVSVLFIPQKSDFVIYREILTIFKK